MTCEEAKLKIQALSDGELPEEEIAPVVDHIQSCYRCRDEYVEFLKLQRRMRGLQRVDPPEEWFERLHRRIGRRIGSSAGQILFIVSYVALLGYAVYSLFADGGIGVFIKIAVAGMLVGGCALLGIAITDRIRESRDDKYKGVMK